MRHILLFILIMLSNQLFGQTIEDIAGLWLVNEVKVGSEIMTPNAKWTRFNSDYTHQSGNGRFEHSYGQWSFDPETRALSIATTNGLDDPFGAFTVEVMDSKMKWTRMEEGEEVLVYLEKINELPETYRDRVLGLWKLKDLVNDGEFYKGSPNAEDYLFIRWDGKFVVGTAAGKQYGVYNVHAHKSEIELIPYGGDSGRSFWSIQFESNGFRLTLLDEANSTIRKFVRIKEFPE